MLQVRVRIGVIVERMPLTYDYGPFTKWVLVQGVTNTGKGTSQSHTLQYLIVMIACNDKVWTTVGDSPSVYNQELSFLASFVYC